MPPARQRRSQIPRAKRISIPRLSRVDVTRGEHNAIIDILNQRNDILNALRAAIERLERASETQLVRIAQLQVEVDNLKRHGIGRR